MADPAEAKTGHNSKNIDFKAVAKIMTSELQPLAEKGAKNRGDISAVKARIDELGANKRGVAFVMGLLKLSPATSGDILRTVVGLVNQLDLGIPRDMVDVAEGKKCLEIPLIENASVDV